MNSRHPFFFVQVAIDHSIQFLGQDRLGKIIIHYENPFFPDVDGDEDGTSRSEEGSGTVPAVYKIDRFARISPDDDLDAVLESNDKILAELYCESLYPLASEWVAGLILFAEE